MVHILAGLALISNEVFQIALPGDAGVCSAIAERPSSFRLSHFKPVSGRAERCCESNGLVTAPGVLRFPRWGAGHRLEGHEGAILSEFSKHPEDISQAGTASLGRRRIQSGLSPANHTS